MSNKEWIDILSKEFSVSRTVAKSMLHFCMRIKKYDNMMKGVTNNEKRKNI